MDKYGLPGGKLESGETLRECVARECLEELGAKVKIDHLIMITEKPKTHEGNTVIRFIYKAHLTSISNASELDYGYFNKKGIDKLSDGQLIRGQDVTKLLDDFFKNAMPSIPDP